MALLHRLGGSRARGWRLAAVILIASSAGACRQPRTPSVHVPGADANETAFLDSLQERTFHYFWDLADPKTRLTPDRFATGFFVTPSLS